MAPIGAEDAAVLSDRGAQAPLIPRRVAALVRGRRKLRTSPATPAIGGLTSLTTRAPALEGAERIFERRYDAEKAANPIKKPVTPGDVDPRFARIAEAFAKDRQVTYGKMFAPMGLKANGKIFAMFVKGKFVTKLPKERVDDLVRRGMGAYFDPGRGTLMKEWVALEGAEESWLNLARDAKRFVGGTKA